VLWKIYPNWVKSIEAAMKNIPWLVVLSVLIILSACSSPASSPEVGSSVPVEQPQIIEQPGEPLNVTPALENDHQAERVIPASGGSLTATGADGTIFQLDIPADALVVDTLIRMIPVSKLEGMPFGSDPYAVSLEPEGLQFDDFVTLTITPAQEIPLDQQIFFGYQGAGENLALVAPVVDSPEIKLRLLHFSGAGVTKGFLADIEPVRARIGGEAEARLQSAVAEQLMKARQEQLLGSESSPLPDFENYFQQYEVQVVQPRVAAASESCAAARLAFQTVLGLERQKQLLGISSDAGGSVFGDGLMDTVAEVCMKEEYEMCRDDHIIHRVIPAWLSLERQYQLLGLVEEGASVPVLEKVKDYVRKCLTFEMQFQSQASFDDGGGGGYDSTVESKIKLQINTDDLSIKGSAPLVNTAFDFKVADCAVTSNRGGDTFEAVSLEYISDTKSPTDELGYVRDFKFIYYPGNTKENFTVTCEDSPPYTSPPSSLWTGVYLITHQGEMSEEQGGFVLQDWEILGNEYFAKKEWITEDAAEGLTEAGTFKLYHRPG
jgi:hypothetical protein